MVSGEKKTQPIHWIWVSHHFPMISWFCPHSIPILGKTKVINHPFGFGNGLYHIIHHYVTYKNYKNGNFGDGLDGILLPPFDLAFPWLPQPRFPRHRAGGVPVEEDVAAHVSRSLPAALRRCDVANEPMVGFSPSLMEPPQKILLRTNHRWIFAYFGGSMEGCQCSSEVLLRRMAEETTLTSCCWTPHLVDGHLAGVLPARNCNMYINAWCVITHILRLS